MPVAVGNVLRVDVIGDFDGTEDLVNAYQFRVESVTDPSDAAVLNDFAVFMRAQYALMAGLWAPSVVWRRVRVANISTDTLIGEQTFSTPLPGTAGGDQGAIQASALVSWKSNIPRVVMRKYFPISEPNVGSTSRLVASAVTALQNFGTTLLSVVTGFSNNTYRFGYLSPKTTSFVVPSSRVVSDIVATQRRRRPGVGS